MSFLLDPYLSGAGFDPGGDGYPVPGTLPGLADTAYWFAADWRCFSDSDGLVPCLNGDPVQLWGNIGLNATYNGENATQPTSARRPTFHTGGAGGRPYLAFDDASSQYFEDLVLPAQPGGLLANAAFGALCIVAEVDDDGGHHPVVVGKAGGSNNKLNYYVIQTTGALRPMGKSTWDVGGLLTPGTHVQVTSKEPFNWCATNNASDGASTVRINECTNPSGAGASGAELLRDSINGWYFSGKLYELVWFVGDGSLVDSTEVDAWRDYLNTKYGL